MILTFTNYIFFMETIIQFLKKRLQEPLPYEDIENEDIDGNLKKFITHAFDYPPQPHRICAVMLALFEEHEQIKIPFIIRPKTNRVHAGQIAFPGGGREEQDKDLRETAIRETFEEVGIVIPLAQTIGTLSNMYVPPSNSLITPVISFLKERPIYQLDPKEVDEVLEVSLKDLLNEDNQAIKIISSPKGTVEMPAFQVGNHLIWGATARVLKELVKILGEEQKSQGK